MNKYNPNIHHRKSIRLKGYDDAQAGLYFVTICKQNRAYLFSHIVGSDLSVSPKNILVDLQGSPLHRVAQWLKTMTTNKYIRPVKNDNWQRFYGKLWQRNYWEHNIRNEQAHQNRSNSIVNNLTKWNADNLNLEFNKNLPQSIMSKLNPSDELSNFLLYTTPNSEVKIEIYFQNETVWLTQQKMADLFGVGKAAVSKHLSNIFESGELQKEATVSILETVQKEGNRQVARKIEYYNLDAIISVGYRVNSTKATQFRIWATQTLKEFIIKGFVMDDARLSNGQYFGKDYFDELLERVRSIRSSERRIYQKITDIFQECSIDYDTNSKIKQNFFASVQNKFHYAITGKTAAEIIYSKVNNETPSMGLNTWKNAPKGRILKSDVTVAKNYLQENEIKQLERTVTGYFDYIENLIERRTSFTMEQLSSSVVKFLEFNEYKILDGLGNISKQQADIKAKSEYDLFNKRQTIESDFDQEIKRLKEKRK